MTGQDFVVDRLLMWLEDQPAQAPASLLGEVLADISSAPQATRRQALLRPERSNPNVLRFAAALLALFVVGASVAGWSAWNALTAAPSTSPTPGPTTAPAASPTPTSRAEAFVADQFVLPFEYSVAQSSSVELRSASQYRYDLSDGPYLCEDFGRPHKSHGLTIALGNELTTFAGSYGARTPLRTGSLLPDLGNNTEVRISDIAATEIGGLPTVQADIEKYSWGTGGYPAILMSTRNGDGQSLGLACSSRLAMVEVAGEVLLVQIWAADRTALEAWLPEAESIVASIAFMEPPSSVSPAPSAPTSDFTWSPEAAELPWPGPMRTEPDLPSGAIRWYGGFADTVGDIPGSAPEWTDIREVTNTGGIGLLMDTRIPLEGMDFDMLPAAESWVAYGLVLDVDGDRVADQRIGIDNALGESPRGWITDLRTGDTAVNLRGAQSFEWFGTEMEYGFVNQYGTHDQVSFFMYGAMGRTRIASFYAWASLIQDGQLVSTDYAPDTGWIATSPWGPESPSDGWPERVRLEPTGSGAVVLNDTDDLAEFQTDGREWLDIHRVTNGSIDLAATLSPVPPAEDSWIAYGLVMDVDRDYVADYRIGVDNSADDGHRAWVTDLATGQTVANVGLLNRFDAFGMSIESIYLGPNDGQDVIVSIRDDRPSFYYYAWASAIESGAVIGTDYAPGIGWLEWDAPTR